ncbi:MAG: LacI family transcriptional regulator [Ruminococcaceae bacterium]|nr:LacI family transcriptional regulator [Oscillospiraceae bacterium]
MNIYDIARLAGVSTATVSRAISGKNISEKTRKKILEIIEKENFRPNSFAQGLNQTSVKIVGILISEIDDLYYAKAVSVLEKQLKLNNYDMILYCTGTDLSTTSQYISQMIYRNVDAIFIIGSKFHSQQKAVSKLLKNTDIPTITINLETNEDYIYNVISDEFEAFKNAVAFLNQKGHDSFLYMYDTDSASGLNKLNGFKKGIDKCQLDIKNQHILKCKRNIESAKQTALDILKKNPKITAVICSADEIAAGVVKAAKELDISIPKDLAVIGCDNSVISDCSTPAITSIDNRVGTLCEIGVNLFNSLVDKKTMAQKNVVPCEIIEKQTT